MCDKQAREVRSDSNFFFSFVWYLLLLLLLLLFYREEYLRARWLTIDNRRLCKGFVYRISGWNYFRRCPSFMQCSSIFHSFSLSLYFRFYNSQIQLIIGITDYKIFGNYCRQNCCKEEEECDCFLSFDREIIKKLVIGLTYRRNNRTEILYCSDCKFKKFIIYTRFFSGRISVINELGKLPDA